MLLAALSARCFGMFAFNKLPDALPSAVRRRSLRAGHRRRFFISIEAWDPKFDADATTERLLPGTGATRVELVERREGRRLVSHATASRSRAIRRSIPAGQPSRACRGIGAGARRSSGSARSRSALGRRHPAVLLLLAGRLPLLPEHRPRRALLRAGPHATQAGWGVVLRRVVENVDGDAAGLRAAVRADLASACTSSIHWSHARGAGARPAAAGKPPYLNEPFFFVRAVLYFAVWCGARDSASPPVAAAGRDRRRADQRAPARARAAGADRSFALTTTFAAIDWMMSLEPAVVLDDVRRLLLLRLGGRDLRVPVARRRSRLRRAGLLRGVVTVEHLHDLAKLLFALHRLLGLHRLLAVLPDLVRQHPGGDDLLRAAAGRVVAVGRASLLAFGHFVVPFFFLMPRAVKRNSGAARRWSPSGCC